MLLSLILILFASSPAQAWPPEWGGEPTFTSPELIRQFRELSAQNPKDESKALVTEANSKAARDLVTRILEKCPMCRAEDFRDKHGPATKIFYPDGFWVNISLDFAVVEIQFDKNELLRHRQFATRIQDHVFDSAQELGLKPDARSNGFGGGHVSLDNESAFGRNSRLYRNYFVDHSNHPGLEMGVLEMSELNAPPLASLSQPQIDEFKRVLAEFDQAYLNYVQNLKTALDSNASASAVAEILKQKPTIQWFQDLINQRVYTSSPGVVGGTASEQRHHQALKLMKDRTEHRGVRPQVSFQEFVDEAELFENRIAFLEKQGGFVPYSAATILKGQPMAKQVKVDQFYAFAGREHWEKFNGLLPAPLRSLRPNPVMPLPALMHSTIDAEERVAYQRAYDVIRDSLQKRYDAQLVEVQRMLIQELPHETREASLAELETLIRSKSTFAGRLSGAKNCALDILKIFKGF